MAGRGGEQRITVAPLCCATESDEAGINIQISILRCSTAEGVLQANAGGSLAYCPAPAAEQSKNEPSIH